MRTYFSGSRSLIGDSFRHGCPLRSKFASFGFGVSVRAFGRSCPRQPGPPPKKRISAIPVFPALEKPEFAGLQIPIATIRSCQAGIERVADDSEHVSGQHGIHILAFRPCKEKNPIAEPFDPSEPFAWFSYAYRCQIGIYRVAHDQEIRAHGPQPVS